VTKARCNHCASTRASVKLDKHRRDVCVDEKACSKRKARLMATLATGKIGCEHCDKSADYYEQDPWVEEVKGEITDASFWCASCHHEAIMDT